MKLLVTQFGISQSCGLGVIKLGDDSKRHFVDYIQDKKLFLSLYLQRNLRSVDYQNELKTGKSNDKEIRHSDTGDGFK